MDKNIKKFMETTTISKAQILDKYYVEVQTKDGEIFKIISDISKFESDEYKLRNVSFDELQKRIANYSPNFVFPDYEKTEFGYQILPDKQNGAGPIYFSMIFKNIN